MRHTDGAIYQMSTAQTRDNPMRLFDRGDVMTNLAEAE